MTCTSHTTVLTYMFYEHFYDFTTYNYRTEPIWWVDNSLRGASLQLHHQMTHLLDRRSRNLTARNIRAAVS